ncbi:MAG: hypothetical protein ACJ75R_00180 [Solirubrobacterales bacterium]
MAGPRDVSRLVNLRLYRLAFIPAAVALVAVMFSLEGVPPPIAQPVPAGTYQGDSAAATARQIVRLAPERPAGSAGDDRVADFVADRFKQISGGAVGEQRVDAELDGGDASVRNVFLTLPGDVGRTIVVVAGRDSPRGPGAASSAAATGALLELAGSLGVAGHNATYVLASTSGGSSGVTQLLDGLSDEDVEAAVVISQPGAAAPSQDYVVASSSGERSASIQVRRTAAEAVLNQVGTAAAEPSAFESLARLAIPSGIGAQAPLIAEGVDAVAISSAGERPLPESADQLDDLSAETLDGFGRATQILIGEIDGAASLEHGPTAYMQIGDNLVPGWSLSLLALALLLPALVAAIDGCARASRREQHLVRGLGWAAARSMPAIGALAVLYGLALVGVVPRPPFPFDPGLHPVGARAVISLVAIVGAGLASAGVLRLLRVTGSTAPASSVAALGALTSAAGLVLWLANPYLALLAAPVAHLWLLADSPPSRRRGAVVALSAALAAVPAIAALASVSRALDLGADAPWTLTIMVADGQLGLAITAASCFLLGGLLGAVALALARGRDLPTAA